MPAQARCTIDICVSGIQLVIDNLVGADIYHQVKIISETGRGCCWTDSALWFHAVQRSQAASSVLWSKHNYLCLHCRHLSWLFKNGRQIFSLFCMTGSYRAYFTWQAVILLIFAWQAAISDTFLFSEYIWIQGYHLLPTGQSLLSSLG